MMFCPKCGSLLRPKVVNKKNALACGCGYVSGEKMTLSESASKPKEIVVVEKEESANPIVDAECGKCGNNKAEHWEVQTRSADEPATRFFRCTKCKHTWREYK